MSHPWEGTAKRRLLAVLERWRFTGPALWANPTYSETSPKAGECRLWISTIPPFARQSRALRG